MILSKYLPPLILIIVLFTMCCSHIDDSVEPRYTYHEFDMVFVYYKTADVETYQKLLPSQFTMPAEPLVMAFVADYYRMDARTMPYLEAAVFLLVDYEGQPAWHCVTMPVTSNEARWGGVTYLGYPKILGDVALDRSPDRFNGVLNLNDQMVMSITLDTQGHRISDDETRMFDWLKTTRSLNILNGEVYEPKFGNPNQKFSLLQVAAMYPDKLEVQVGRADLVMDTKAAAAYSERLGQIFSIRPTEQVLAYYLKNKFVAGFKP